MRRARTCIISFRTLGTSEKNCRANIRPTTPKLPAVMPLFWLFISVFLSFSQAVVFIFVFFHWYVLASSEMRTDRLCDASSGVCRRAERGLKRVAFLQFQQSPGPDAADVGLRSVPVALYGVSVLFFFFDARIVASELGYEEEGR